MSVFAAGIFARLNGDATLTALLATYQGAPCIFLGTPVPPDAPRPYLWSDGPVFDVPFDSKTQIGRDFAWDLSAVTDASASPSVVEAIVERARVLLHRHKLAIAGYGTVLGKCTGPVGGPSDDTVRARVLTASWLTVAT